MLYLIATLLLNVAISSILKLYPRYRVDALQAIVANYVVCVATGSLFIGRVPFRMQDVHAPWFPWSVLMGLGFISVFNLTAYCTRADGITTTTIASKLSLVIPVLFSIYLYHEQAGIWRIAGILLAFPAVYLAARVSGKDEKPNSLFWPALLFAGSGMLDSMMKYVQASFLAVEADQAVYTIYTFGTAGVAGLLLVAYLAATGRIVLRWQNLVAGICLGIPNYFSIYFLIRMLNSNLLPSSAAIPVLNIGILTASALTAILFFGEQAGKWRIAGLLLSVVAILLIAAG